MNKTQKIEEKNTANEYRYSLGSSILAVNRSFVLVFSNQDYNARKNYLKY